MKIEIDKQGHILGCWAIAASVGHHAGPMAGFLASAMVGLLKEVLWDWYLGKGTPSGKDLLASVVGAMIGAATVAVHLR